MNERGARVAPENGAKGNATLAETALLMAAFFVGTDFVSVKYALEGLPPLVLVSVRYVVAGFLVCRAGLLGKGHRRPQQNGSDPYGGLGLRGGRPQPGRLHCGPEPDQRIKRLPHLCHRTSVGSPPRHLWGSNGVRGVALGSGPAVVGIALVVGGSLGSEDASVGGDLLVCLSAISWGAYTVLSLPCFGVSNRWSWLAGRCCLAARRPSLWPDRHPASPNR